MVEAHEWPPFEPEGPPPLEPAAFRRLVRISGLASALVGLLTGSILVPPPTLLVWNATASAPIGLYRVCPNGEVGRGDMIVARTPSGLRALAAARGYIPATVPLVKHVAAVEGDWVCAINYGIWVNDRLVARRRVTDRQGRTMPWWSGCLRLEHLQYFLLNAPPTSFDSRYFGPIGDGDIVGKAVPLWLR